jgi:hypothetical protein
MGSAHDPPVQSQELPQRTILEKAQRHWARREGHKERAQQQVQETLSALSSALDALPSVPPQLHAQPSVNLVRPRTGLSNVKYQLRSVFFNSTDPRFWIQHMVSFALELVLIVVQLAQNWSNVVPRWYMLIALAIAVPEPFHFVSSYRAAVQAHAAIRAGFAEVDVNKDGVLNPTEAANFLRQFPEYSLRYNKNERYTADDVIGLLKHRKRHLLFVFLEFLVSWLCFAASLMLYNSDPAQTAIAVVQGVLAVFDIMLLLHRFMWRWASGFVTRFWCMRVYNRVVFYSVLAAITVLLLAGFSLTEVLQSKAVFNQDPADYQSSIPQAGALQLVWAGAGSARC